jgi:lipoprotein-anchoring transpeptidase ErfK/SrfK
MRLKINLKPRRQLWRKWSTKKCLHKSRHENKHPRVFENEKLIAAYPVTIGSGHTASPIGDWKVRGIAKLPRFRYAKEMLEHDQRSGNFYMLPPGPRNPVGVMWIALNKKGIGIHGTNDPSSIGHAVSHGCIRLANWDVVRLATKIKPGDNVSIH